MLKTFFAFLYLFLLASCAVSREEQEVKDAVLSANVHLTAGHCQQAIDVLEGIPYQDRDVDFLKALSSGYACRGGYNTSYFFANDLTKTSSPATWGGFSLYSTSNDMTTAEDVQFDDLQKAIEILLYAGGIDKSENPTVERRELFFGADDLADIHTQLMYLLMVQIGRYMYYYGNADTSGVKGLGTQGTNKCLANYDGTIALAGASANITAYIGTGATGPNCTGTNLGHADLGTGGSLTSTKLTRICQIAILINNFFEVFPSIVSSVTSGDLSAMSSLETQITAVKTNLLAAASATTATVTSALGQQKCEADNSTNNDGLEVYLLFMAETLFQ